MRLQESQRVQRDLEAKLAFVHSSISVLSGGQEPSVAERKEHSLLSEKERQRWKEEWEKKTEEATEFAKKMKVMQKERKQREEEKRRTEFEKLEEERQAREKLELEKAEQLQAKKKEEEARRLKEFNEKREERKVLLKLATQRQTRKPYLYEKMQEKYMTEVEMPELEKRKKNIAEKRNIYRPLRKEDLDSHQRTYDEVVRKCEEERKKEAEKKRLDEAEYLQRANKYKTAFTDEVLKQDQETRDRAKSLAAQQKEAYIKKMTYAKIVKESCVPQVSEIKAMELKRNIERLKNPVRKPPVKKDQGIPKANPLKRESWSSGRGKGQTERAADQTESEESKADTMRKIVKKVSSVTPTEPSSRSHHGHDHSECGGGKKRIDYLTELRMNREATGANKKNYESVMRKDDLSPSEKYELVKAQAEVLEENARRKEQLMNVKGECDRNGKAGDEVSDMYIDAIKAKLSLLEL